MFAFVFFVLLCCVVLLLMLLLPLRLMLMFAVLWFGVGGVVFVVLCLFCSGVLVCCVLVFVKLLFCFVFFRFLSYVFIDCVSFCFVCGGAVMCCCCGLFCVPYVVLCVADFVLFLLGVVVLRCVALRLRCAVCCFVVFA